MHTKFELVPWELPLLIVMQLSGVNEGVVVSISRLNDLPTNLIPWFLKMKIRENLLSKHQNTISNITMSVWNIWMSEKYFTICTTICSGYFHKENVPYLLVFVKQKNQKHKEDGQNACCSSQCGSEEFVCAIRERSVLIHHLTHIDWLCTMQDDFSLFGNLCRHLFAFVCICRIYIKCYKTTTNASSATQKKYNRITQFYNIASVQKKAAADYENTVLLAWH